MIYSLPEDIKATIKTELQKNSNTVVFGAIAKEIFPTIKSNALLIGDRLKLFSYDEVSKVDKSR